MFLNNPRSVVLHLVAAAILGASAASQSLAQTEPTSAPAQAPSPAPSPAPRSGGLLPERGRASTSGAILRQELIKRWDLNTDGRIDESEADVARLRMRQDRNENQRNRGLDPLTGRQRVPATLNATGLGAGRTDVLTENGTADESMLPESTLPESMFPESTFPLDGSDPLEITAEALPAKPKKSAAALPGTRAPQVVVPTQNGSAKAPVPRAQNSTGSLPVAGSNHAQEKSAEKSGVQRQTPRAALSTGGTRAGAAPVRPGYGSNVPINDLNAGRVPSGSLQLPDVSGKNSGTRVRLPSVGAPATVPRPGINSTNRPQPRPVSPGLFPPAGSRISAADMDDR
jgi:hypothetical protein